MLSILDCLHQSTSAQEHHLYKFHKGAYSNSGKAFGEVIKLAPNVRSIGLYYDDPGEVSESKIRNAFIDRLDFSSLMCGFFHVFVYIWHNVHRAEQCGKVRIEVECAPCINKTLLPHFLSDSLLLDASILEDDNIFDFAFSP